MKTLSLTSTLIAALAVSAAGESTSNLLSKISSKEKELAKVSLQLSGLRKNLKSTKSSSPSSSATYVVKSGDTLSKIARMHKASYSELVKWNKISDPSLLSVGQKLIVGESKAKTKTKASAAPSSKPAPSSSTYTVSRGDTFYGVARQNNISIGKLTELNPGVEPSRIVIGQKLKVSGSPAPTVKKASTSRKKTTASSKKKKKVTKKSSTTAITRSSAPKAKRSAPTSSRKKSAPKPVAKKKKEAKPAPAPTPPKVEESVPATPKSVSSVILTSETTFSDFASKHSTSTTQLNALNGWNLPKATVLARGSEIYVPK